MIFLFEEWIELILRWFHVIAGIAWIGSSFYFIALDLSLKQGKNLPDKSHGEAWQVHGGGFYHLVKYLVAPSKLPSELTWFKWEAYATWVSGFALLALIYYAGAELYMIDIIKYDFEKYEAVIMSILGIIFGWLIYDIICRISLKTNVYTLIGSIFILITAMSWVYSEIFSYRGAFMQIGTILGTIMVANVAMVIIPGQKKVVNALIKGNKPDPIHGIRAKQRSLHNNYLTLPVIFVMLAGHYPMVFATKFSWLILAIVIVIGALIRHFFNSRHAKKKTPWWTWVLSTILTVFIIYLSNAGKPDISDDKKLVSLQKDINHEILLNAVNVVEVHCAMCHAKYPSWERMSRPPKGLILANKDDIILNIDSLYQQVVLSNAMPPGNITWMEYSERETIKLLYQEILKNRNISSLWQQFKEIL